MMNFHRFSPLALLSAVALAVGAAVNASAQQYPDRPIRMIVPYPPGGPNDVLARIVGHKLTAAWGQPVVIDNRPGASGHIGMELAAKATPDGYTLVLAGGAIAWDPMLYAKLPYSVADFAAVTLVAKTPLVLVVHPSLPVSSVKELIALAKSRPGQVNYASGGSGTSPHLAAELFKFAAGVDLSHVPYKGTGDLMRDLLSGLVPVAFVNTLIAQQHVKAARLKPLGLTSPGRLASWPDVPTIAEAGVPGYEMENWYGVLAPARTAKRIVAKLSGQIAQDFRAPDAQEKLASLGADALSLTPEQTAAYIEAEAKRWAKIIRAANIRVD